jgi:tellurite resistance protein TerC
MSSESWIFWTVFLSVIGGVLALDLGVFHRHARTVRVKEALGWCALWFSLAMGFAWFIFLTRGGSEPALAFLTGYLIELCLSVDNVFVFVLIFTYFKVPSEYHHRVLFWGILGAVVMRAVFILAGLGLIQTFHWIIYVFGAFLVYTGIKMAFPKKEEFSPEKSVLVKLARRHLRMVPDYDGARFFSRVNGRYHATPLFLVLLVVEATDVIFALDSIPAILAITTDGFIVFTSNIFAILGLRSLYFALAGVMGMFRFLSVGLAVVLAFVGVKMLISGYLHVPVTWSMAVIASVLAVAVGLSLLIPVVVRTETPAGR